MKYINNTLVFLIIFFPVIFITGPALSDISVTVVSLIGLGLILINRKSNEIREYFFFFKKYIYCSFLFYLILIISSIFSDDLTNSLDNSVFFIRFLIYAFLIPYVLLNFDQSKNIAKIILITFSIVALDGYIQLIFGKNILGFTYDGAGRLSGFFGDELILGKYLISFFFIAYFYFESKYKKPIFLFIFLSVSLILVFLSGERMNFILFCFGIFLILIINIKRLSIKKSLISILGFMIIFYVIILFSQDKYIDSLMLRGEITFNDFFYFTENSYFKLFKTAYVMFKDNFIIGVGVDNFSISCVKYSDLEPIKWTSCATHPHNFYLEIMSETGILGLTMFIFFIYGLMSKVNIFAFKYWLTKASLINMCIIFFPIRSSNSFFSNWNQSITFFLIGLFLFSIFYESRLKSLK